MLNKTLIIKLAPVLFAVLLIGCAGADAQIQKAPAGIGADAANAQAADAAIKPLVAYYSRTGNSRKVASALAKHLGAEVAEIQSEKDRGIFTIMGEQWFWGDDRQKPFEKNLQDYSPIIVVAPVYFMQLSAPGRFFIEEVIPDGSQVYVFTTSGGPLAGFSRKGIEELVTESGLIAKGVHGFQAGKTQEEVDSLVCEFLKKHQITGAPGECAPAAEQEPAGDTK
ncbi:MAG: hypothetical protein FJ119_13600, partial [Deltaproteobacteria bacterium]|nr:hypothetical protein [Deltaproteobacteria bacterium]